MINDDATWSQVVSVKAEDTPLTAYNLTVSDFHTYFVSGSTASDLDAASVWVHNNCPVVSRINESRLLVREAERAGRNVKLQSDIDKLIAQLAEGNLNPGLGSRPIGKGISEARGRSGGRVYFRKVEGKIEVLGKSGKANQPKVIAEILKVFG